MNIVRGILIALLVAGLTLFSVANNDVVPVNLGFVSLNVWLPFLVLVSFALGLIPVWLKLGADRMLLKRKLAKAEAALGDSESALAQARVELLRPPATGAAPVAPAPATIAAPPPGA